MPAPAMKPIVEVAVKKAPRAAGPGRMPTSENGIASTMVVGVVTELELAMVANARLTPDFEEVDGQALGTRFAERLSSDATIQMAYGRLDVAPDRFLERGLLVACRPAADQSRIPPATGSGVVSHASRYLFRAQLGSARAKRWRWWTETELGPMVAGEATRNTLLNQPVITLADGDPGRTDVLHEYVVEPARFGDFVRACRDVVAASYQQQQNVTVRHVGADRDSVPPTRPRRASPRSCCSRRRRPRAPKRTWRV